MIFDSAGSLPCKGDSCTYMEIISCDKKERFLFKKIVQNEIERPHWHALRTPRAPSVASTYIFIIKVRETGWVDSNKFSPAKSMHGLLKSGIPVTAKKFRHSFDLVLKCGN